MDEAEKRRRAAIALVEHDIAERQKPIWEAACACLGKERETDPGCRCVMRAAQERVAVILAAMERPS